MKEVRTVRKAIRAAVLLLALAVLTAGLVHVFRPEETQITGGSSAALGMMLLEREKGLYVLAVTQDSPSDKAGFRPGDYLLLAEDVPLDSVAQLDALIDAAELELTVRVRRSEQELMLRLPAR